MHEFIIGFRGARLGKTLDLGNMLLTLFRQVVIEDLGKLCHGQSKTVDRQIA